MHCSSSKLWIWIQVTTTYLGFTHMECSWLEPLEIFVQIIRTSRSCILALLRICMCFQFGSGVLSSENIWWAVVSEGRSLLLQCSRVAELHRRFPPKPSQVYSFLSVFITVWHFMCYLDVSCLPHCTVSARKTQTMPFIFCSTRVFSIVPGI